MISEYVKYVALLHIIVTYTKESIITKLQNLYSPPRKLKTGNKWPVLLLKKLLCMSDLSPVHKTLPERPVTASNNCQNMFIIYVIDLSSKNKM